MPRKQEERFACRLKPILQSRGLTQRELAEAMGTTIETVNRWANGRTTPCARDLYKLSKVLDVPVDDLMALRGWRPRSGVALKAGRR